MTKQQSKRKVSPKPRSNNRAAAGSSTRAAMLSEHYVVGDRRRVEELRADRRWFADNKARVVKKYPNQYVAIVGQRVVDHDANLEELTRRVYERSEPAIFLPFTGADAGSSYATSRSPKVAEA